MAEPSTGSTSSVDSLSSGQPTREEQQQQEQHEQQQQQQHQQHQQYQQDAYSVGIDFGSSSSVVASASIANPQSISIEVNRLANRDTPTSLAFDGITR